MKSHNDQKLPLTVVTGATGILGRHVVGGLLSSGRPVRAVSRRPRHSGLPSSVEVVAGDLHEPSTLEDAFTAASALVLIAVPETAVDVVTRARATGIEHIVVVSSAAVTAGHDTTYNLPVERAVQASGPDWSIVRPGEFATNALLIWGPSIRSGRRVVEPYPEQAGNPIHERDIADVVVADLLDPGRRGRVDTIVGPDTLTKREQVAAIAAAVGDHITLDEVTSEQARSFYREQGGFAADNADWLYGLTGYDGVEGATDESLDVTPPPDSAYRTLTDVLGRPGRSYAQWARDHASDFTRTADRTAGPGHD
ncbi:SDR family oxidoreductase [Streptomyces rubiginosohelvolus]|uniref:SDR family oxidoreductase n=1 Tax=unclassified Streptomyces TaxID=2593676 RepID=UPI00067A84C9|nr:MULTISPECIES: NAD(P)H-binding protein [unclassified Streptomyces]MBK3528800.1 NAD(P)H-binding protein [Streptomyces sp. MBT72]MBK3536191.1 NAD(P)H-binding protein [Streptomyces sp. MBT67]MBK3548522.1 NAD(P)H-binding protein [Streptomyces sp. MBT61]MBK6027309.1 NAD(P)H-binding protein [Streptomyces sp. MBT59]